ncbi:MULTISPECIES: fasciclin domain-containing protein [unclassified Polaribacter]|uniref:fasciclin domain-containing protein n=1 Tax=unclassified Polaribacter TaxID=196858 RepID=UPI001678632D|nr:MULTISPECIES: fasciclin domain-containing protein [unclassified Polaribacter]
MKITKMITLLLVGSLITVYSCAKNADKKKEEKVTVEEVPEAKDMEAKTIVGVAADNENFTTLVAAVTAADLVETLNSAGPFTVFAPINAAFDKLPEGTVATLLKPENKEMLTSILTYHVVSGTFNAAAVIEAINDNDGKFVIKTVQGGILTASLLDGQVILTDTKGNVSTVVIADVAASNGIVHAIDTVLMPE